MLRSTIILSLALLPLLFGVRALNNNASPLFTKALRPGAVEGYERSRHVKMKTKKKAGMYHYAYKFKDHKDATLKWKWSFDKKQADKIVKKFGIPKSMFKGYRVTKKVLAKRKRQLKKGAFKKEGGYLVPDYNAMVARSRPFTKPIAHLISAHLAESPAKRDRIEMVLRFTQDIPYGVPPDHRGKKYIGGIYMPPSIFKKRWGDCDSKLVLFTSILSHFAEDDLVAFDVPGHVFLGVAGIPRPYQKFKKYRNKRYIFAEPVGPARRELGRGKYKLSRIRKVRRMRRYPKTQPATEESEST